MCCQLLSMSVLANMLHPPTHTLANPFSFLAIISSKHQHRIRHIKLTLPLSEPVRQMDTHKLVTYCYCCSGNNAWGHSRAATWEEIERTQRRTNHPQRLTVITNLPASSLCLPGRRQSWTLSLIIFPTTPVLLKDRPACLGELGCWCVP